MNKILLYIIFLAFPILVQAQFQAPAQPYVEDGDGFYRGFKKVVKVCPACSGDFYVSTTDGYSGAVIQWFTNTKKASNIINKTNGLLATKALLKWGYTGVDIDVNGLATRLNAYPPGLSGNAAGAIEACFQMNYENGQLVAGTTPANMWYLPAQDELMVMYKLSVNDKNIFVGSFTAEAYWSSTEANAIFAWSTLYGNEYTFTNKSILYGVRCIRR